MNFALFGPFIVALTLINGADVAQRQVVAYQAVSLNAVTNAHRLAAILGEDCDVTADELTNTFFVRASPEKIKMARYVIRRADDVSSAVNFLHVFSLKHASAAHAAKALIAIMGNERDILGRPYYIRAAADLRTNSVIVDANKEKIRQAKEILDCLDTQD